MTVPGLKQAELRKFDEEDAVESKTFRGCHVVHSSGSTGIPGYFVYNEKAWQQMLLGIIRGALWNMTMLQIIKLLLGRPKILYIAATGGRYGGAMAVGDGIRGVGASQKYLDINTPLEEWVKITSSFRPDIIIGYPSAIKILGELVNRGRVQVNVKRVISCGEPLSPGLRRFLKNVFRAEVVNFYGSSESLVLGVETEHEEGMILFDDLNLIEVVNGAMYLTSLYNFAQPLIRYRISDHLVLKEPPAGNPFTRAEILLGRDEDILWFADGKGGRDFLHPLAVEGFCVEGLRDYQFCQIDENAFEMLAEVTDVGRQRDVRLAVLARMKEILAEKKLTYVQFYVRFVDEIMPDRNLRGGFHGCHGKVVYRWK